MGITLSLMKELRNRGVLTRSGLRVLDIGSSNLYLADTQGVIEYVRGFTGEQTSTSLNEFAARIAKGSAYDPVKGGLNESFAGELIERCGMGYLSMDIARGYKTEILDLNRENLPRRHRGAFDVVLNIGTTEHVLNQYNSFKVVHEAARTGGLMVHQLPVAGFTDHGYYVYTGRMFFDLAGNNQYEIVDLWYESASSDDDLYLSTRSYANAFPVLAQLAAPAPVNVPNYLLTIIYRKAIDAPFLGALEVSTSVGEIPGAVRSAYVGGAMEKIRRLAGGSALLRRFPRVCAFLRELFPNRGSG